MKSSSVQTAAKTVILCLRWAAVVALVSSALGELVYSALDQLAFSEFGSQARVVRPAPLAVMQGLAGNFLFWPALPFVVAGAMIAPQFRCTTASVLAALQIAHALWGHVLALAEQSAQTTC